MSRFLISVITPCYNSEKTIARAIRSVAQQALIPSQHIIIDDGSTDNTPKIIQNFCEQYSHIYFMQQKHQGAGIARNLGIEAAIGRYVLFLDSDDQWLPKKIETQINFMEESQCLLSYGDYSVINFQGQATKTVVPPNHLSYSDLLNKCPIGCLTAAYNQEELGKQYMPLVRRGQDWGLWLAITKKGVIARKYPGNFAIYLDNTQSLSKNKFKKSIDMLNIYRDQEKIPLHRALWHLGCFTVNKIKK